MGLTFEKVLILTIIVFKIFLPHQWKSTHLFHFHFFLVVMVLMVKVIKIENRSIYLMTTWWLSLNFKYLVGLMSSYLFYLLQNQNEAWFEHPQSVSNQLHCRLLMN